MTDYNRKLTDQEKVEVRTATLYIREALIAANGKLEDYFADEDHLRDAVSECVIDGCDAEVSAETVAIAACMYPSWEHEPTRLVLGID